MPILPPEPNCFPETLFSPEASPPAGDPDQVWWLLHARPRQEKALARQLLNKRISFYLPLVERKNLSRGRVLSSHVPLFTSYVFLHGNPEERIAALATNHVVQVIAVNDQARLWRDLSQLSRLIATGKPVTAEDKLGPGSMVEVRSGLLAGLKGKILRTASGRRFVVEIDFIHKGASVLLDDYVLAKGE